MWRTRRGGDPHDKGAGKLPASCRPSRSHRRLGKCLTRCQFRPSSSLTIAPPHPSGARLGAGQDWPFSVRRNGDATSAATHPSPARRTDARLPTLNKDNLTSLVPRRCRRRRLSETGHDENQASTRPSAPPLVFVMENDGTDLPRPRVRDQAWPGDRDRPFVVTKARARPETNVRPLPRHCGLTHLLATHTRSYPHRRPFAVHGKGGTPVAMTASPPHPPFSPSTFGPAITSISLACGPPKRGVPARSLCTCIPIRYYS
ncbi:hypothetical protein LY76DRAFT_425852 [Colletotrichum caudatum]|nr:hypothetical protein LY76DRAFT_425852 [Colletotrichum caudatum]